MFILFNKIHIRAGSIDFRNIDIRTPNQGTQVGRCYRVKHVLKSVSY